MTARIIMTVSNLENIKKQIENNPINLTLEYSSKKDKYKWIVNILNKCRYRKLKKIEGVEEYLKEGVTFELLDVIELEYSDNEFAKLMKEAE